MAEVTTFVPQLCPTCTSRVVHGTGFKPEDAWRALVVVVNIGLWQASSADHRVWERCGKAEGSEKADTAALSLVLAEVGCLGCFKPKTRDGLIQHVVNHGLDDLARIVKKQPYPDLDTEAPRGP